MNYTLPLKSPSGVRHLWREDKRRLGGLDLLRSAAIVSVVLFHYSMEKYLPIPFVRFGWVGVLFSFFFTMLVVLVTAAPLYLLVERPCLKFRDRLFAYKHPQPSG